MKSFKPQFYDVFLSRPSSHRWLMIESLGYLNDVLAGAVIFHNSLSSPATQKLAIGYDVSALILGPSSAYGIVCVALPGFQAPFRNDRATKGGGVCIYISTKISCTPRHDLNNPKLEILWVEISLQSKRSLLFGCCYRPPHCDQSFYEYLEGTLEYLEATFLFNCIPVRGGLNF